MFGIGRRRARAESDALWLDLPDADARIRRIKPTIDPRYSKGLLDLVRTGFAVFPGVIDAALCDEVTADYRRYLEEKKAYADQYVDGLGRHNRLVNFHLTSEAALKIGFTPFLMEFLDLVFAKKAGIYTSLTFEYGTEQPIHRDSPFFHTFPINYFVGAWVALEDIAPEAGPLMYVPGAHRFLVDQHAIFRDVKAADPDLAKDVLVMRALDRYNGAVIKKSNSIGPCRQVTMNKGDLAVWHPTLPHGGSPALDRSRTRRSIVFHCAPESTQVYQQDVFFTHEASTAPPPRYGYRCFADRTYAVAGETAFM